MIKTNWFNWLQFRLRLNQLNKWRLPHWLILLKQVTKQLSNLQKPHYLLSKDLLLLTKLPGLCPTLRLIPVLLLSKYLLNGMQPNIPYWFLMKLRTLIPMFALLQPTHYNCFQLRKMQKKLQTCLTKLPVRVKSLHCRTLCFHLLNNQEIRRTRLHSLKA